MKIEKIGNDVFLELLADNEDQFTLISDEPSHMVYQDRTTGDHFIHTGIMDYKIIS